MKKKHFSHCITRWMKTKLLFIFIRFIFLFFSHMEKNRRNLFNLWNRVFDIYSFFSFIKMKEKKVRKKIQDTNLKKNFMKLIFFHMWKRNSTVKKFKNIFIFRQNVFILRFAHVKKNPSKNNTFNLWNSV